jgi:hypothetical protein
MSQVVEINAELVRLSSALAAAVIEYEKALKTTATAQTDYEVAKAQAELKAEGTETQRKAEGVVTTKDLLREFRIARATERAYSARIESLQTRMTATQTRAAFEREEMKLAGRLD